MKEYSVSFKNPRETEKTLDYINSLCADGLCALPAEEKEKELTFRAESSLSELLSACETVRDTKVFTVAAEDLADRLKKLYARIMTGRYFTVLNDADPARILLSEGRCFFTDFSQAGEGEPATDAASFTAHVLISGKPFTPFKMRLAEELISVFTKKLNLSRGEILRKLYEGLKKLAAKTGVRADCLKTVNAFVKKIVICPDSFKGTLTSGQVCAAVETAFAKEFPNAVIESITAADGGEGTLECYMAAAGGKYRTFTVTDADGRKINAEYLRDENNNLSVIESAKVIGLPMTEIRNPMYTSTYGLGQLIRSRLEQGDRVALALGGSSTTDGGAGILSALGAVFYGKNGRFVPTGGTLKDIEQADFSNLIKGETICVCDVENPFCGPDGAAFVYAPQKGASPEEVILLDQGLRHFADILCRATGRDPTAEKGAGAAGGISGGLWAAVGAPIRPGAEFLLEAAGFSDKIADADFVITGEGKLDRTSFSGKLVGFVVKEAAARKVPVTAISGVIDDELNNYAEYGLKHAFYTAKPLLSFEELKKTAYEDLIFEAARIAKEERLF